MYSQNNEEEVIIAYFQGKKEGKFIDIGAYNPFRFSNTRKLYELGWSGVFVEPSSVCFGKFMEEYKNDPRIELCNYAIGSATGKLKFYDSEGDAISTTCESHKKLWESRTKYKETEVECIAMDTFISVHGKNVDFLTLDTEGANLELFDLLIKQDAFMSRVQLLCIEHEGHNEYMTNKLRDMGFSKKLLYNAENIIVGR